MKTFLYRFLIELTNGRVTSKILYNFARSKMSRRLIPSFAKTYHINISELAKPLEEFETLHEFFTRTLKEGSRIAEQDAQYAVSPVDAVIEDIGVIGEDSRITVKGKAYSIEEMLGDKEKLEKYIKGNYMIFYLSPSHYHRIHSPVTGTVVDQWTLGRKSYPVNQYGLKYGRRALSKNYRKMTEVQYGESFLTIVKVGAMFVNSIELIHEGERLERGKELAYFSFGSTVVLLFEKDSFEPLASIQTPHDIIVGERIGLLKEK